MLVVLLMSVSGVGGWRDGIEGGGRNGRIVGLRDGMISQIIMRLLTLQR